MSVDDRPHCVLHWQDDCGEEELAGVAGPFPTYGAARKFVAGRPPTHNSAWTNKPFDRYEIIRLEPPESYV